MKRIKKKHLARFLRISTIFSMLLIIGNIIMNFTGSNVLYAGEGFVKNVAGLALNGIASILAFFLKWVVAFVAMAMLAIIHGIMGESGGLEEILFSGGKDFPIIAIDFFNFNASGNAADAANTFREAVAQWYYVIRLISIAALLVILIYVGIRMALSTIASDQTKYKKMLVDWATSMALVFLLHYIIVITITINTSLITTLTELKDSAYQIDNDTPGLFFVDTMSKNIKGDTDSINGLFCAVLLCIFAGETIMFLVYYIKRMVTVGFLIMISPLITITYSIDKIGDGKSQALDTWLKEFIFNVLIQPFHCILYLAFFGSVASIMEADKAGLMGYILAIVITLFIYRAEGIIKQIFGFKAGSMGSISETGQSVMNATGAFTKGAATVTAGTIALGKNVGGMVSGANKGFSGALDRKAMQNRLGSMTSEQRKAIGFEGDINKKDDVSKFMKTTEGQAEFKKTDRYKARFESRKSREDRLSNLVGGGKHKEAFIQRQMKEKTYHVGGKEMSYEEAKDAAANGNQVAKEALAHQRQKAESNYKKPVIGRAIGSAQKFTKGAANTWNKLASSDFGQASGKVLQSLATAGVTIGAGAVGAGFAGQINDAITGGQIGYGAVKGITEGIFERTTKNSAKGTANVMDKMGWNKDNAENNAESTYIKGETGELGKEVEKSSENLQKGLMGAGLDDQTIDRLMAEIRLIMKDDKRELDLNALLSKYAPNMDAATQKDQMKNMEAFKNAVGESVVYSEMKNQEGLGLNHADYIAKVVKALGNTTNVNNTNITQNIHEETKTEVNQTFNEDSGSGGTHTQTSSQGRKAAEQANREAAGENERRAEKSAENAEKDAEKKFKK